MPVLDVHVFDRPMSKFCVLVQVEAKNSLENYAFNMRNTIRDEKVNRLAFGSRGAAAGFHRPVTQVLVIARARSVQQAWAFCDHITGLRAYGLPGELLLNVLIECAPDCICCLRRCPASWTRRTWRRSRRRSTTPSAGWMPTSWCAAWRTVRPVLRDDSARQCTCRVEHE